MCTWAAFQEVLVFTLHSFVHFSSLCHLANWSLEYSSPSRVFFVPFPHEITRDQLLLLLLLITLSGSEPINHVSCNAANEMELEEWHSDIINWIKSPQSMNKRKCYKNRVQLRVQRRSWGQVLWHLVGHALNTPFFCSCWICIPNQLYTYRRH